MPIQTKQEGNTAVVSVSGRLDAVTGPPYQTAVAALVESGTSRIVVDLSELVHISSAGLRELLVTDTLLKERDGRFCVASVHGNVASVFEMCGMGKMVKICDSVADALAAVLAGT